MKSQIFDLEGVTCGGCAKRVEASVRPLPGLVVARVDVAKKELTLASDGAAMDVEAVVDAVARAGYTARPRGGG